jgi:carnitine O-acetyltransferase
MSSKHLQTRRLLATLQAYLYEIRGMLIALWREANERPEAFVDHAGVLRDARTGKAIEEAADEKEDEEMCKRFCLVFALSFAWPGGSLAQKDDADSAPVSGFGFFDVGAAQETAPQAKRRRPQIGE